jgi:hypothetical protein
MFRKDASLCEDQEKDRAQSPTPVCSFLTFQEYEQGLNWPELEKVIRVEFRIIGVIILPHPNKQVRPDPMTSTNPTPKNKRTHPAGVQSMSRRHAPPKRAILLD